MNKPKSTNERSRKIMSVAEAAYVAGFIDGEGTIGILRETRKEALAGFRYTAYCHINNSCLAAIEAIRAMTGNGRLVPNKKMQEHHKQQWRIFFTPNQIRHILPQIIPYLIVKYVQANLVMEFLNLTIDKKNNYSNNKTADQHELYLKLRELNKRGLDKETMEYQGLRDVRRPDRPSCSVDGCLLAYHAKGYCRRHYKQFLVSQTYKERGIQPCSICGKDIPSKRYISSIYCSKTCKRKANYQSWLSRHGDNH